MTSEASLKRTLRCELLRKRSIAEVARYKHALDREA